MSDQATNKTVNLVRFNIQNAKYAIGEQVKSFGTSIKMALETDSSTKVIYGDGKIVCTLVNERGKNAVLTLNNICDDYEIAMGRKMKTTEGLADIKQIKTVGHNVYFEICNIVKTESGTTKTTVAKTWLLGCISATRPSESYDQTTTDINESSFELPFVVNGINLLNAEGTAKYVDADGNELIALQVTKVPGETGYESFEDTVPIPKVI